MYFDSRLWVIVELKGVTYTITGIIFVCVTWLQKIVLFVWAKKKTYNTYYILLMTHWHLHLRHGRYSWINHRREKIGGVKERGEALKMSWWLAAWAGSLSAAIFHVDLVIRHFAEISSGRLLSTARHTFQLMVSSSRLVCLDVLNCY